LFAAREALKQPDYMTQNVSRVINERERLCQALAQPGVTALPSKTNFLLVRAEVPELVTQLRDVGVLVSHVSDQLPEGFFRVSVGTSQENDTFLNTLARRLGDIRDKAVNR
jgi:histidinol-phosphate aminotransferase